MVPILSKRIYRHTHKDWRKEERLGKQRKSQKNRGKGERGRQAGEGPTVFCLLWISRISTTSRGAQRGNKAGAPGLEDSRGAAPSCCWGSPGLPVHPGPPVHPPTKPPSPTPTPSAPLLTSRPSRQGEHQQAELGDAHAPGHGGSWPLAQSALTSTRPCQPPNQAAALLESTAVAQQLPARSQPLTVRSAPQLHRGLEEGQEEAGWKPERPLSLARGWGRGWGNCSGVGDQGRETPSPRKGRDSSRWALPEEGWGLEFVGIKLDPSLHSPFSLSHAGLDALGVAQEAAHQHRPPLLEAGSERVNLAQRTKCYTELFS